MRVVQVNLAFEPAADGAALARRYTTLRRLAQEQAALGAEVLVLQRFDRDEETVVGGVRWLFRADDPKRLVASPLARPRRLADEAAAFRPDVVQLGGLGFPAAAAFLKARLGRDVTLVVQDHGSRPIGARLLLLQRLALPRADAFLFTDPEMADPWRKLGVIHRHATVFGVPEASSDFAPVDRLDARRATGVDGDPALLWVGRLHQAKAPLLAFAGFAGALEALPETRLHVVFGEDPLRDDVDRLLRSSPRLAARVRLVGRVAHDELPLWYSAADLFLTASPWEGSNYALIEAFACGLPAVASANPAHRALVERTQGGVLFPPGDEFAFTRALLDAARRPAFRNDAARAALRERFVARLSWRAVAAETLDAYQKIRAGRRARTAAP